MVAPTTRLAALGNQSATAAPACDLSSRKLASHVCILLRCKQWGMRMLIFTFFHNKRAAR